MCISLILFRLSMKPTHVILTSSVTLTAVNSTKTYSKSKSIVLVIHVKWILILDLLIFPIVLDTNILRFMNVFGFSVSRVSARRPLR